MLVNISQWYGVIMAGYERRQRNVVFCLEVVGQDWLWRTEWGWAQVMVVIKADYDGGW